MSTHPAAVVAAPPYSLPTGSSACHIGATDEALTRPRRALMAQPARSLAVLELDRHTTKELTIGDVQVEPRKHSLIFEHRDRTAQRRLLRRPARLSERGQQRVATLELRHGGRTANQYYRLEIRCWGRRSQNDSDVCQACGHEDAVATPSPTRPTATSPIGVRRQPRRIEYAVTELVEPCR